MFVLRMWFNNGPEYSDDAVFFGPFSTVDAAEDAYSKRVANYCHENDCSSLGWNKLVIPLNAADVSLEMAEGEVL